MIIHNLQWCILRSNFYQGYHNVCVLGIYKKLQNMGYMWSYTKFFAFERKVTKGRDTLCFFKDNNHCIIFDNFIYKKK